MQNKSAILVVDDDDAIRRLIVHVLRREQYELADAADGREALELLRSRRFEMMVLDLMMPVMTGFEVLEYLGTHDDAGSPCVIVVSAAGERRLTSITDPHVHAVLRKPFDLATLLTTVRQCATDHFGREDGTDESPVQDQP